MNVNPKCSQCLSSPDHFEIESAAAEITRPAQTSRLCHREDQNTPKSLKWPTGNICTFLLLSAGLPVCVRCKRIERSCSQSEAVGITKHRGLKHKTQTTPYEREQKSKRGRRDTRQPKHNVHRKQPSSHPRAGGQQEAALQVLGHKPPTCC